jgi:hypothetical protein
MLHPRNPEAVETHHFIAELKYRYFQAAFQQLKLPYNPGTETFHSVLLSPSYWRGFIFPQRMVQYIHLHL